MVVVLLLILMWSVFSFRHVTLLSKRNGHCIGRSLRCIGHTSEAPAKYSSLLKNFVTSVIEEDVSKGKNGGRVVTRFPPEPNGYLHVGHAKSVSFNFAVAKNYGGVTHMRFDDTNPSKEDLEYVHSILDDVRWLVTGNSKSDPPPWHGPIRHASDYFQAIYDAAEFLITQNLAYVDDSTPGKT